MKTNLFKNRGKYVAITALSVTTIIVVVVFTQRYRTANSGMSIHISETELTNSAKAYTSSNKVKRTIKPPLNGIDVPYQSFRYKAEKGAIFSYGKSRIKIPENCLVDKKGKLVKGDVDIQYREFRSPIDFFVSGIPMTYDSGGKEYTFESNGMFDIKGFHNGEEVYVKEGKKLEMNMPSLQSNSGYNFYRFDTVSGQWAMLQSNVATISEQSIISTETIYDEDKKNEVTLNEEVEEIKQEEKKIEEDAPFEPQKAGDSRCLVSINADTTQYPELAIYKGIWFAVDHKDTAFNMRYTGNYKVWRNLSFKRIDRGQTYQATVSAGTESHTFILHPVFTGSAYQNALVFYNKKFKEYESALNEKKEEERKKEEAYKALLAKEEEERIEEAEEKSKEEQEAFHKNLKTDLSSAVSYYCLNIKKFGTYNCDNPELRPRGFTLATNYTDDKQEDLNSRTVYLIEKGKNILNTYTQGEPFCFNPESVNFAWCVTPDNHIAVFTNDDFKKINIVSGRYTMVLQKTLKNFKSEEELDAFFKQYI